MVYFSHRRMFTKLKSISAVPDPTLLWIFPGSNPFWKISHMCQWLLGSNMARVLTWCRCNRLPWPTIGSHLKIFCQMEDMSNTKSNQWYLHRHISYMLTMNNGHGNVEAHNTLLDMCCICICVFVFTFIWFRRGEVILCQAGTEITVVRHRFEGLHLHG